MPIPIKVDANEIYNEERGEFVTIEPQTLILEHSLLSISKWESKWHKMFLETKNKTTEELIDYIRCMTINKGVDPYAYYALSQKNIEEIVAYMEDPMTASYVNDGASSKGPHERVSSELIYYWIFTYNIPMEVEKWHINRLMMLLRIFSKKNSKATAADKAAAAKRRAELNRQRCARLGTRG